MTPERLEFVPAQPGEPSASSLIFGLAGTVRVLEVLTCQGESDRELLGNLASASDCLARLLVHRMGNCPASLDVVQDEVTP